MGPAAVSTPLVKTARGSEIAGEHRQACQQSAATATPEMCLRLERFASPQLAARCYLQNRPGKEPMKAIT